MRRVAADPAARRAAAQWTFRRDRHDPAAARAHRRTQANLRLLIGVNERWQWDGPQHPATAVGRHQAAPPPERVVIRSPRPRPATPARCRAGPAGAGTGPDPRARVSPRRPLTAGRLDLLDDGSGLEPL